MITNDRYNNKEEDIYLVTCTVVRSIDIFTRVVYRELLLDSLRYAQQAKGLVVYAWLIMPDHIQMIVSKKGIIPLGQIIGSFKSFTSKRIRDELTVTTSDSRKDWLLDVFGFLGSRNSSNKEFQLWRQDGSNPICMDSKEKLLQSAAELHNIPVKEGLVTEAAHWRWSSANNYAGGEGLLDEVVIVR